MDNNKKTIDLNAVFKTLWGRRKLFYKIIPIVITISALYIFPQPRYYSAEVSLAPESSMPDVGGGLASIASSFGFNLGSMASNDAIYPTLYPELFESPEFLVSLLDIKVQSEDGEINCDYYTYLKNHQKKNPWTQPIKSAISWVKGLFVEKKAGGQGSGINAFRLSEDDYNIVMGMQGDIVCTNDKRTDVTTIRVQAQDAQICAMLADSISARLQNFIIMYRTSKARMDLDYYQKLSDSALVEYNESARAYSDFCDANKNIFRQVDMTRKDQLQNDLSMKQTTYQAYQAQVQAMRSKVQERTPAFTTLKSATIPIRPAGPKRLIFIIATCFIVCLTTAIWICRKELHFTF